MTEHRGFADDETAPFAAVPADSAVPAPDRAPVELRKQTAVMPAPALPAPAPAILPPAGWYPLSGEQRYWDGRQWTEHRAPAPAYQPVHQAQVVLVTDARTNSAEVAIAWVLTVLSLGYLLPWAVAATRGKSNSWAVGLVTFLVGWTVVGWVVALVMACTAHQLRAVQARY